MARGEEDRASGDGSGRGARLPWRIPLAGWREIAIRTWRETGRDNAGLISAGVAFYGFLALVPLLGAFVLSYGLFADPDAALRQSQRLFELLPPDAARLIGAEMQKLASESAGKTGLGLVAALALSLYGAMRGGTALVLALNVVYDQAERRGMLKRVLIALGITVGAVLVGLLAVAAIAALGLVEALLPDLGGALVLLLRCGFWTGTGLAATLGIATLYRYGPNRARPQWRWVAPGALLAALLWLGVSLGFGFYTSNFGRYDAVYGALGTVVVLLMWLYLSAYVLMLGAELNAGIEQQTQVDSATGRPRAPGRRHTDDAGARGKARKAPLGRR